MKPPTDEELEAASVHAQELWAYGTDDEIWSAIFRSETVAAELLDRIRATGWKIGDLTHDEAVSAILKTYPYLV